jgi:hypothetical protein
MSDEPRIEQRSARPYAAVRRTVTLDGFAAAVDAGFPALFGGLAARGQAPTGAPFIRYRTVDMGGDLEIDLAAPVATPVVADTEIVADELPAGSWIVARHVGPYDGLIGANEAVRRWAAERDLRLGRRPADGNGEHWTGRVETYLTNPSEEPDPAKWEVELAYLVAD